MRENHGIMQAKIRAAEDEWRKEVDEVEEQRRKIEDGVFVT